MKRKMWRAWQTWLKVSIPLNMISWFICACMLDSETIIPAIVCLVNGAWLCLLAAANSDWNKKGKKEEQNIEFENIENYDRQLQGSNS